MKSNDRKTLLTAVAVSSLLAAGVGALVGKTMLSSPPKEALAVEAKEDHAGEKPHVGMSAERIAADGIQVLALAEGGLDAAVPAQATVAATPHGAATLAARADGAIVRINKRLGVEAMKVVHPEAGLNEAGVATLHFHGREPPDEHPSECPPDAAWSSGDDFTDRG